MLRCCFGFEGKKLLKINIISIMLANFQLQNTFCDNLTFMQIHKTLKSYTLYLILCSYSCFYLTPPSPQSLSHTHTQTQTFFIDWFLVLHWDISSLFQQSAVMSVATCAWYQQANLQMATQETDKEIITDTFINIGCSVSFNGQQSEV